MAQLKHAFFQKTSMPEPFNERLLSMNDYGERLAQAIALRKAKRADLAKFVGCSVQAVGDVLNGKTKAFTAANNAKAASFLGINPGWLATGHGPMHEQAEPVPIDLDSHPDLVSVRKVKLRLQGGISGFAVEPEEDGGTPIFFRAEWMRERGYKPYALLALKVRGHSMEPSLFPDDMVVINTAESEPKDGEVFAVNYEGEPVIKRLVREGGEWWLASDNPDKTRYPNKRWRDKESFLVGRVVHKQSERI
jgi:phage repressor protein C with HTH and peptisase S24 domain